MSAATGPGGITLTANEVSGTEELVSEIGTYSMTDKAGKEIDKGKYIVLWNREIANGNSFVIAGTQICRRRHLVNSFRRIIFPGKSFATIESFYFLLLKTCAQFLTGSGLE